VPYDASPDLGGTDALTDLVHRRVVREGAASSGSGWQERVAHIARSEAPLLDSAQLAAVVEGVTARANGMGPLESVLVDPSVTEVMVNGPGRDVWIERDGRLERLDLRLDAVTVGMLVERVVAPLGLRADRTAPLVDARLPDGSRVNIAVPPLAIDGPYVTIRRFGARAIGLDETCAPAIAELLGRAVRERRNIVVSGGTGAGKTTLLNALAACIPRGERVVTVEDAAELRLPFDHVVRLEARPPNAEGIGGVTMRELVRNALRMRPDRIVVGEVRGAEALDMVQAMNTGHEGSLSTCHANSPADSLRRLETMILTDQGGLPLAAVREQLAASIDLVVQVARTSSGRRGIVAVDEVEPHDPATFGAPVAVRRLSDGVRLLAEPMRPVRARA
jgi:pilus assembly protein CpaF